MTRRRLPVFYGWVVVVACLVISTVSFAIRLSFGVFFKALESDFGWTRAQTSGIFSVYMLLCCIIGVLAGLALDRYKPVIIFMVTGFVTGLGLLLTSQVTEQWQLFVTYSLLLAAGTGATNPLMMALIPRWFTGRRGLPLGIMSCGAGIGLVITAPVSDYLISSYGWQTSYFIMGLAALCIMIPFASLLKEPPRQEAPLANGRGLSDTDSKVSAGQDLNKPKEFSILQLVKTRNFWLLLSIFFLWGICIFVVLVHIIPHAIDLGISSSRAASILSVIGIISIPSRLLMGKASDGLGRKRATIVCALIQAAAMLSLLWATNLWTLYIFAALFGFSWGGSSPVMAALVADISGLGHIGLIMGLVFVGLSIGSAIGPTLAGHLFDISSSYIPAFLGLTVVTLIVIVLTILLQIPKAAGKVELAGIEG